MKAGWEVKALGEVATVTKRQGGARALPYVGLEDVSSGGTGQFLGTMEPQSDKSSTFEFAPHHLLYGRLRPYLNKVLLPAFEGHCSSEIFPILPSAQLDRRFLFYWITNQTTVDAINDTCTGARMPRANVADIFKFPIPLPPLDEQKRIVEVLDAAFEGLSRARAHTETNLQNARELFESALGLLFSDTATWKREDLNKHVQFVDYRGKTPPKTLEGVRLITAKNVKRGYIQREPEEFMDEAAYDEWMTRGFPEYGDVLFTTEAPLANVAQLDTEEKVVVGQRLINMKADPKVIHNEFLKFALLSPTMQDEIHRRGTGATVQGIKASLLKTVPLSFPASLVEQREIAGKCRLAFEVKGEIENLYRAKLADLDALRQALLQKAFAGELT